jgi:hypothetical protein
MLVANSDNTDLLSVCSASTFNLEDITTTPSKPRTTDIMALKRINKELTDLGRYVYASPLTATIQTKSLWWG